MLFLRVNICLFSKLCCFCIIFLQRTGNLYIYNFIKSPQNKPASESSEIAPDAVFPLHTDFKHPPEDLKKFAGRQDQNFAFIIHGQNDKPNDRGK